MAGFIRRYPLVAATLTALVTVLALHFAGQSIAAQWIGTGYVVFIVALTAVGMARDIARGHYGLDILAVVAMAAAIGVGEYIAAMIVVLMLTGGEALEDFAAARATRDLDALLKRAPVTAHRMASEEPTAAVTDIPVDDVRPGDLLLVKPSQVVPVDGNLLTDEATFDESSLTGESLPVAKTLGDPVLSGSVNTQRAVRIRATADAASSQYQQIIALVQQAEDAKAPTVRLADRYAIPFTLISLVIAGLAWWLSGDPVRFASVLVLATPCPLLIAAPVAFMGGMSASARSGIIVKGGATLEALARAKSIAFDKTGTLSHGEPELVDVITANGISPDELLRLAASAEQYSSHVLAKGVIRAALERGLALSSTHDAEEIATNGVRARIDGRRVVIGKLAFVRAEDQAAHPVQLGAGQTSVAVAVDGRFVGTLLLADRLRENAAQTVEQLRGLGFENIAMLTGDNQDTAGTLADQAGIGHVHAELLPAEKVERIRAMPGPVIMVGDGVNDAPVLAMADVGIAMGARGSTAASESADAVIVRDDVHRVVRAVEIGRHTYRVALTAIWIGIVLSLGLMLVAAFGYIPPVAGALTQEVVDLAAILYALRALTGGKPDTQAQSTSPTAALSRSTRLVESST
ncbi:heavy metal translocating P-type ATPase [Tessaracoccus sp. MC1865]|uniref:heavy metal translocating P-type ATPase n=1 Tax=Tessaracoccus sp. MC1865 TaxID=2760310 RepID=UPI001600EDCE|nr:heavy metal translocating P-type ATPase [Tessaracoccus sp. MC1865]MBB1483982.1 heavy metal translocating P-type ATPase [Tessaracoccus sp. MC1865]QTO37028.1 heavy metal translocating P-type ATPase [Tessaracoccus sp. MC1865]